MDTHRPLGAAVSSDAPELARSSGPLNAAAAQVLAARGRRVSPVPVTRLRTLTELKVRLWGGGAASSEGSKAPCGVECSWAWLRLSSSKLLDAHAWHRGRGGALFSQRRLLCCKQLCLEHVLQVLDPGHLAASAVAAQRVCKERLLCLQLEDLRALASRAGLEVEGKGSKTALAERLWSALLDEGGGMSSTGPPR